MTDEHETARLNELRQMIAAPSSDYSAGAWCEAANEAVLIAVALAAREQTLRQALGRRADELQRMIRDNEQGPDMGWTHEDEAAASLRQDVAFIAAELAALAADAPAPANIYPPNYPDAADPNTPSTEELLGAAPAPDGIPPSNCPECTKDLESDGWCYECRQYPRGRLLVDAPTSEDTQT